MAKDGALPVERDHVYGGWLLRWNDAGSMREVWARSYDETFTQYDVEVVDRELLPADKRRKMKGK
jgi:hypothetical protein